MGDSQPKNKRLSVERIYQKKSQLEHILLRPDTYIGSVNPVTEKMWILDSDDERIVSKEITYVPGLYKIFDEILVNAADNKVRDPRMDTIKIDISPERNEIKIFNNGNGIPIVHHKDENMYVPTMIFGHLLTSSNFDDEQEKVTGGRNGYGAKLCNVFSQKFTLETANKSSKKEFKQSWGGNMSKAGEAKIKEFKGDDYTRVTFYPDLEKFNMESLDKDIVGLLSRRAYDVAASCKGVKVYLNGKRIPVKGFKDYVDFFLKGHEDETGNQIKCIHEIVNDRWEIAVAVSDNGFQQMSFVNSIATSKGGRHVDYVAKMIENNVADVIKKKNKGGVAIKPHQIRNHLWVFINCLIVNPTFDSQTKENMTLQQSKFGSKCQLSTKFFQQLSKSGVIDSVLAWSRFKADQEMKSKHSSKKTNKLKGISKLEDANNAGTKNSIDCTLIITEGDSAKTLAVAGLSVIGRDNYGVFPLRGKMLNVREATHKQIMENREINDLVKIIGLQHKKKYLTRDDLKTLRYGKLMIMTDQDQDGSHIKGLVINFIHHNWPSLLKLPFLEEFITPIVKATKGNTVKSFYSLPEFNTWREETQNWATYKIKYYKGLGTSTSKEAKEYFSDMRRHRILFHHESDQDDHSINMAFSKKAIEQRKEWLTEWMQEGKRRKELGLPEVYLYEENTSSISYTDFINKELVLFSNLDNERSIPSLVDGFKPGQRKVMFTCLKRNDKREVKVAQLAGSVGEMSAYHHGEMSLMGTIINLAQNYVGSNNINLLQPIGQFGTRLAGGKDHASPRYIFTQMSPLTRLIFNVNDDPILKYLQDDNQKIEPEWYMPILPMVLVNGADGIGTGWMTKIPNFNPRDIVSNLKRMLNDEEPVEMNPWFKGFQGTIVSIENHRYIVNGEIATISDNRIEITELPIRTWTQTYKEQVMEAYLNGGEKQPQVITDYKEYHTDITVKFVVQMDSNKLKEAECGKGLHQFFKLQTSLSTSSMVLFDAQGCLRRFDSATDILKEFYDLRLSFYQKRKDYMEGSLEAEAQRLSNQARFILEKCAGTLVVENKKKKIMIEELQKMGFDSDPVKKWKKIQDQEDEENADDDSVEAGVDYDYLLGMPMWSLTQERKDDLLKKRDDKQQELRHLRKTSIKDLWLKDLDEFLQKLEEVETKEREEDDILLKKEKSKGVVGIGKGKKKAIHASFTPQGIRVAPRIPEELRAKAAKAAAAKDKKADKKIKSVKSLEVEEKDEFDLMCESKDMNRSLSEKLNFKPIKKKKVAAKKTEKRKLSEDFSDSGSSSEEDLSFHSSPKRAKNDLSSENDSSFSEMLSKNSKAKKNADSKKINSDSDSDLFVSSNGNKENKPTSPVPKKPDNVFEISSDDEFMNSPKKSPLKKKQTNILISSGDENMEVDPPKKAKSKSKPVTKNKKESKKDNPKPKKESTKTKAPAKSKIVGGKSKKKATSDSEDNNFKPESKKEKKVLKLKKISDLNEMSDDEDEIVAPKLKREPSRRAAASKAKFDFSDSDDDFTFDFKSKSKGSKSKDDSFIVDTDSDD